MARMTNRERDVIVDEIYSKVSLPIKEENEKKTELIKVESDEYQEDWNKYWDLEKAINSLEENQQQLKNRYKNSKFNGVELSYWAMGKDAMDTYIQNLKRSKANIQKVPSKNEIEKQVILAGNKDIPALIEELTLKLKG